MRYYEQEHFDAYAEIRSRRLSQWSDLHEDLDQYSDFPNRTFLEGALPALEPSESLTVFEYGCGTGPTACFLAKRGYSVRAVDLVPDAIEIARAHAAAAGVPVDFAVEDVCKWTDATETYDVVLDSYCLQSIVLNDDRALVLEGVRRRLKSGGRYVLSTSVYDGSRRYGNDEYDPLTGIVWREIARSSRGCCRTERYLVPPSPQAFGSRDADERSCGPWADASFPDRRRRRPHLCP